MIDELTEVERIDLRCAGTGPGFDYVPTEEIAKAVRIIDAQTKLLEQVKRYVQDVTLFSDPTLRIELARLLGLNWQYIYRRSRERDLENNNE